MSKIAEVTNALKCLELLFFPHPDTVGRLGCSERIFIAYGNWYCRNRKAIIDWHWRVIKEDTRSFKTSGERACLAEHRKRIRQTAQNSQYQD